MRLLFVLTLALLILPISGCAKKKKDDSSNPAPTASNASDADMAGHDMAAAGHDMDPMMDDPAMSDPMMDDPAMSDPMMGHSGHDEMDPMLAAHEEAPGMEEATDPALDDMVADAANPSQNRKFFKGGAGGQKGHGDAAAGQSEGNAGRNAPAGHASPEAAGHDDGEMPVMDEVPAPGAGVDEAVPDMGAPGEPDPAMGDPMGPEGMGDGGQPAKTPTKPTDIPGVEEGTAEYAAVSLILKVARGETEGLEKLVAEDSDGMLAGLRKGDEKAMAEAKELMGRVQKNNSRLENRDTVIYFRNDKDKILQFYVRKIQGDYVVREIRVREAAGRTPAKRRR